MFCPALSLVGRCFCATPCDQAVSWPEDFPLEYLFSHFCDLLSTPFGHPAQTISERTTHLCATFTSDCLRSTSFADRRHRFNQPILFADYFAFGSIPMWYPLIPLFIIVSNCRLLLDTLNGKFVISFSGCARGLEAYIQVCAAHLSQDLTQHKVFCRLTPATFSVHVSLIRPLSDLERYNLWYSLKLSRRTVLVLIRVRYWYAPAVVGLSFSHVIIMLIPLR